MSTRRSAEHGERRSKEEDAPAKSDTRKRRVVVVCAIVIVIAVVVLVFATFGSRATTENDAGNMNGADESLYEQTDNAGNIGSGTSVNSENIGNGSANSATNGSSTSESSTAGSANARTENLNDGSATHVSAQNATLDEREREIDSERAVSVSKAFLSSFCTYDADSLSNGSYRASFIQSASSDAISKVQDGSKPLLYQHALTSWEVAMGSRPESYSKLESFGSSDAFVSPVTHAGSFAAEVECTMLCNADEDASSADWYMVNEVKRTYVVYLDDNYMVTDVRIQSNDVLRYNVNGSASEEHGHI